MNYPNDSDGDSPPAAPLRMLVHATWASKLAAAASILTLVTAIALGAIWVDRRTIDGESLVALRLDFSDHVKQDNAINTRQAVLDQEIRDWMARIGDALKILAPPLRKAENEP